MPKVMIITGGFKGIGFATAQKCLKAGHKAILVDKDQSYEATVHQNLSEFKSHFITIVCDVTNESSVEKMVEQAYQTFGKITTVINNAGIFVNNRTDNVTKETFDKVMDINVWGSLLVSKYAIPYLRQAQGASIVNVSSITGLIGTKNRNLYVTSKHALVGVTRNSAIELAVDGIRVNAVCPGLTETDMSEKLIEGDGGGKEARDKLEQAYPLGRLGLPEEIANAIYFLASDDASFITGAILPVDGGYIAA